MPGSCFRNPPDGASRGPFRKNGYIPLAPIPAFSNRKHDFFRESFDSGAIGGTADAACQSSGFQYLTVFRMFAISLSISLALAGAFAFTRSSMIFAFSASNVPGYCERLAS